MIDSKRLIMTGRTILKNLLLFAFLLTIRPLAASNSEKTEKIDTTLENIIKLRKQYSFNKTIPAEFEKEILISLSFYPELSNTRIEFCYGNIFTSMKAVPTFGFLFQRQENRKYRIVMNRKECSGTNVMQRAGSRALVGVLGHELGHIKDYSQRNNFQLLKLLISYISKKGRVETEKRADQITIDHNLGEELLEFNNHVHNDACMDPKYIRYKKKFYNSSEAIGGLIEENESAKF